MKSWVLWIGIASSMMACSKRPPPAAPAPAKGEPSGVKVDPAGNTPAAPIDPCEEPIK